jgi:hypothetical protein
MSEIEHIMVGGVQQEYTVKQLKDKLNNLNIDKPENKDIVASVTKYFKEHANPPKCRISDDISSLDDQGKLKKLKDHFIKIGNENECKDKKFSVDLKEPLPAKAPQAPGAQQQQQQQQQQQKASSQEPSIFATIQEHTLDHFEAIGDILEKYVVKYRSELESIQKSKDYESKKNEQINFEIPIENEAEIADRKKSIATNPTVASGKKYIEKITIENAIKRIYYYLEQVKSQKDQTIDDVITSAKTRSISFSLIYRPLEIMKYNLSTIIKEDIFNIKKKLGLIVSSIEKKILPDEECADSFKGDMKVTIIHKENKMDILHDKEKVKSLFSLEVGKESYPTFLFNTSHTNLSKTDSLQHLTGVNGYGFLTMLKYYCAFMSDTTGSIASEEEKIMIKNDIMPFLIHFKTGFDNNYTKFNFTKYISNENQKMQIFYLMVIHQVHFIGTLLGTFIFSKEELISLPDFNLEIGTDRNETKTIESISNDYLVKKYQFVPIFIRKLNNLKNMGKKFTSVEFEPNYSPGDLLDLFNEYVRFIARDLKMVQWRSLNIDYVANTFENVTQLRERVKIVPVEIPKKGDEADKGVEVGKKSKTDAERIAEHDKRFEKKKEQYIKDDKERKEEKAKELSLQYTQKVNRLQAVVQNFAFKNKQDSIWNAKYNEVAKRKGPMKDIMTPSDLDDIVRSVMKEIERIFSGLSTRQQSDKVIKSINDRNNLESEQLLREIAELKAYDEIQRAR